MRSRDATHEACAGMNKLSSGMPLTQYSQKIHFNPTANLNVALFYRLSFRLRLGYTQWAWMACLIILKSFRIVIFLVYKIMYYYSLRICCSSIILIRNKWNSDNCCSYIKLIGYEMNEWSISLIFLQLYWISYSNIEDFNLAG